jgi:hypothetical protein
MNIGDKIRLRDGVLPWITKRDGWEIRDGQTPLMLSQGDVRVYVRSDDIEPESPPIPPWTPTEGADMRQAITEAIGTASVAWTKDGVFDEQEALRVADGLFAWLTEANRLPEGGSPPIPPEPPRVVGQAWRDAEGRPVIAVAGTRPYLVVGVEGDTYLHKWETLAHPLTPLVAIPSPDDDEAVGRIAAGTTYPDGAVRAVLRVLRQEGGR